ncbi:putative Fe-containing alcohol dehydrogenase [Eremomyces bilateralis CBS 781.70]|uniref:Fe-containing alcohol dehydrogenase n=1 Tax=Eremomyces bilateralis CBS 781.70 TaxID=1392243 RepID=A0A6G1FQ68_9PEZI|nr:putative Fe-containing alcohol dehydrogenase [Eremomyces bilateralis CBS 781.70]KAF1807975.1 putative Fe-containing alcohol dehydrogenase [Eremomyces bilateralis CBS 781.70]
MPAVRIAPTRAVRARNLLRTVQNHPPSCPCHSNPTYHQTQSSPHFHRHRPRPRSNGLAQGLRRLATPSPLPDYAFELAASSIRFGPGSTAEVGMDVVNMGAERVMLVTDPGVAKLPVMENVRKALAQQGVKWEEYTTCRVEPKEASVKDAIAAAKPYNPDLFIAVGGGSAMDTTKMMNLYTCNPDADLLDFVNAPVGKGLPIRGKLRPLIAIPTTAGTGSETTGTAIFDLTSHQTKTGVAHRAMKPTLGICDPENTRTMPSAVACSSGLDVLCHSLESWTAIPYQQRRPRPTNPIERPAYQGANPISDIFSLQALKSVIKYLPRAVADPDDYEAQEQMLLAATLAGVGFGNAGVHLCHGMSYPISGMNRSYMHNGYDVSTPLIPHGVSVAVTAPAVFRFTGPSNPDRHLAAAECFGVDISNVKQENAGEVLSEALKEFLVKLGDQPRGLKQVGYTRSDIDVLVEGTLPQRRVLMLAPGLSGVQEEDKETLTALFEEAMEY